MKPAEAVNQATEHLRNLASIVRLIREGRDDRQGVLRLTDFANEQIRSVLANLSELEDALRAKPGDPKDWLQKHYTDKAEMFDALYYKLLPEVPDELIERVFAEQMAADRQQQEEG